MAYFFLQKPAYLFPQRTWNGLFSAKNIYIYKYKSAHFLRWKYQILSNSKYKITISKCQRRQLRQPIYQVRQTETKNDKYQVYVFLGTITCVIMLNVFISCYLNRWFLQNFDIFQYYWPLGSWSLGTIVKEKSRNVPCASDEGESALFYPLWCPFSFLQYRWAVHFGLVNFAFLIFLLRKSFFTFLTLFLYFSRISVGATHLSAPFTSINFTSSGRHWIFFSYCGSVLVWCNIWSK